LIRRWEKAVRTESSDQLVQIYQEIDDGNIFELLTAPFCDEYDIKTLLRESTNFVPNHYHTLEHKINCTFGRSYWKKKRNVPDGFQARKGVDYSDYDTVRNTNNERSNDNCRDYVDIRIVNGEIAKSSERKFRTILLRAVQLGNPTTYRDQF